MLLDLLCRHSPVALKSKISLFKSSYLQTHYKMIEQVNKSLIYSKDIRYAVHFFFEVTSRALKNNAHVESILNLLDIIIKRKSYEENPFVSNQGVKNLLEACKNEKLSQDARDRIRKALPSLMNLLVFSQQDPSPDYFLVILPFVVADKTEPLVFQLDMLELECQFIFNLGDKVYTLWGENYYKFVFSTNNIFKYITDNWKKLSFRNNEKKNRGTCAFC